MPPGAAEVRRAAVGDAAAIARLLHAFNTEFGDPTPGVDALTPRIRELLEAGEITALLAGDGPDGFALLRFWPSYLLEALDAHLAELYVVPERRGGGLGRALMEAAMTLAREEGAKRIDLNTGETDTAARALYESLGFTNREGGPDGPPMLYYERDL